MNWFKSFWKRLKEKPVESTSVETVLRRPLRKQIGKPHDNFTFRSIRLMILSRQNAGHSRRSFVGTEHILLGLLDLEEGVGFKVLQNLGLDMEGVRNLITEQIGIGPDIKIIGNIPYTPRVKRVIEFAAQVGRELKQNHIGTEHILLGLLREGGGVAPIVLKQFGITLEKAREEVLKELSLNSPSSENRLAKDNHPDPTSKTPMISFVMDGGIPGEWLGNFTPRASEVLALARKEAIQMKRPFADAEHILLGLIALGKGIAFEVLNKHGVELTTIRQAIVDQVRIGNSILEERVLYSPRIKQILVLAGEEANSLKHIYIGTEHILLGLLRLNEGFTAKVFDASGMKIKKVRSDIEAALSPDSPAPNI